MCKFTSVKSRNQFRLSRKGRILSSKHYYLLFKHPTYFLHLNHAENYQNKKLFAYFMNYCVLDDTMVIMMRLLMGGLLHTHTFICWTLTFLDIILEASQERYFNFVAPYWRSHKHNNNKSNISNNYSESKLIGVFSFSLWFPVVFHSYTLSSTWAEFKCFLINGKCV